MHNEDRKGYDMKKSVLITGVVILLMMSACAKNSGTDNALDPGDRGTLQDAQRREKI